MIKSCVYCGTEFDTVFVNLKKFCSKKCSVRNHERSHPREFLLRRARNRAVRRGLEFNLTINDIPEIPTNCPILGMPIRINDGGWKFDSVSLDRIDSSKGYITGNVRIISSRANHLKSNATIEELEKVLADALRARY